MNPDKKYPLKDLIRAYNQSFKAQCESIEPKQMFVSYDANSNVQHDAKPNKAHSTREILGLPDELEQINREHYLQVKIDQALEAGNKPLFMQLSGELNQIKQA